MDTGIIYKNILNFIRNTKISCNLVFGIKIYRTKTICWDVTTLVLKKAIDKYINYQGQTVLEMGCGHIGLLSQYIKKNFRDKSVTGADIYKSFIENAHLNARQNGLDIDFIHSDLYDNIDKKFDFILFNPPYKPIKFADKKKLNRFSSNDYLYQKTGFSGKEGVDITVRFLKDTKRNLNAGGIVLLGINCFYVPHDRVLELIEQNGYGLISVISQKFNTAKVFVIKN